MGESIMGIQKHPMNFCETYKIPCPYALSDLGRSSSLSCMATKENCEVWRLYYTKRQQFVDQVIEEKWNPSRRYE